MKIPIYLDYNATTPVLPEIANEMNPYLEESFGNPSSGHYFGKKNKTAVRSARKHLAALINAGESEIIFTSGGSESNNLAIKSTLLPIHDQGGRILISAVEHPAVNNVCRWLEQFGFHTTHIPVDAYGVVDMTAFIAALDSDVRLVSIMLANNETGSIQPIKEITAAAHALDIPVHCDAAQAVGKIPVDVRELGVDLLSIAGHKFYAPKGIGALFIREGFEIEPLIHGAAQENGHRAGTENVLHIVGLGAAAERAGKNMQANTKHSQQLRDRLLEKISAGFNVSAKDVLQNAADGGGLDIKLNGHPHNRLPNTLNISFRHVEANQIISALSNELAMSAGAACNSEGTHISDTIEAMGVPLDYAVGTLRISLGALTTKPEIDKAANLLVKSVKSLKLEPVSR